jgi:hypothetical protein
MLRRLFEIASGLSLLLCIATAASWFRSRQSYDWIDYVEGQNEYSVLSRDGELRLLLQDDGHESPGRAPRWSHEVLDWPVDDLEAHYQLAQFSRPPLLGIAVSDVRHFPAADNFQLVVVPSRSITGLSGVLPAVWLICAANQFLRV